MKPWKIITAGLLCLLVVAGFLWIRWQQDAPRRTALATLGNLSQALISGQTDRLLDSLVLPQSLQGRTLGEQSEFLTKALRDEISADGIAALKRGSVFGPLTNLFPAEAESWASQAGVAPENCLAFRMEKNGLRAEVVLLSSQSGYRIIRCNNVKQMADTKP